MDKIKLVIWDLDETFWKGTLSEEGITIIDSNIELVKTLTNRGIINSIASKNDFEKTKKVLVDLGIWEYFIFPKIDWLPKGQLVKNIIEEAQLRAPNVLFLDDNHLNIEEVEYYNKDIHAKLPDFIDNILEHSAFKGKDDSSHSRLKQYKVLEEKSEKSKSFSDNTEFLRYSDIKIRYSDIEAQDIERVHELVERTNKLNFTKLRSSKDELEELFKKENIKTEKIEVWDKFGDYGVVGFYSIDTLENKLVHFVFSCRTMNIGVEQFVYSRLNYPKLEIVGDTSGSVGKNKEVDWIEELKDKEVVLNENNAKKNIDLLLKGGCDLGQMIHYLQYKNIDISTEFNDVNEKNIPLHKEHTVFAKNAYDKSFYKKNKEYIDFIPFVDKTFFDTKVYSNNYDILVYSLLMDYTQEVYQCKSSNCQVSYGGYGLNLIDDKSDIIDTVSYINQDFLDKFEDIYNPMGQISPSEFEDNLDFIITKINKPIILINGAELNPLNSPENNADKRQKEMNEVVDKIVNKYDNVYLLDMRKIITNLDMLEDNIRHYKREVYIKMSEELISIIESITDIKSNKDTIKYGLGKLKHFLSKEVKQKVKNFGKK